MFSVGSQYCSLGLLQVGSAIFSLGQRCMVHSGMRLLAPYKIAEKVPWSVHLNYQHTTTQVPREGVPRLQILQDLAGTKLSNLHGTVVHILAGLLCLYSIVQH